MSPRYTVRFSVDIEDAEGFEDAARKAWADIQEFMPVVDVTDQWTWVSDSVDLGDLDIE